MDILEILKFVIAVLGFFVSLEKVKRKKLWVRIIVISFFVTILGYLVFFNINKLSSESAREEKILPSTSPLVDNKNKNEGVISIHENKGINTIFIGDNTNVEIYAEGMSKLDEVKPPGNGTDESNQVKEVLIEVDICNVVKATYFSLSTSNSRTIDVRDVLDRMINEKKVTKIYVNNKPVDRMGYFGLNIDDPCPGEKKVLYIEYDSPTGRKNITVNEGEYLIINRSKC